ncbi:MAG TPA: DUF397 domain-containing protein [Streptosporangiaceae bacterium]|jgi:hypothetical protein|nr:DUF397 domain-containing protein [Streptosporangiaceae bacterium]
MEIVGQGWRKSSYTGNGGNNCVEVGTAWRKSSFSGNGGAECVEVARNLPRVVAVRDSKDRNGPMLTLTPEDWRAFTGRVKTGRLDLA